MYNKNNKIMPIEKILNFFDKFNIKNEFKRNKERVNEFLKIKIFIKLTLRHQ